MRRVLVAEGPVSFPRLIDGVARAVEPALPTSREVAEALERLVWAGEATADGLGLPRAGGLASSPEPARGGGQVPPPSRRRATSRRGRTMAAARAQARAAVVSRHGAAAAFDAALAGRWSALAPCGEGSTVRAVALVESLIDRYGVVTRDIALAAGVPGGLSALYPVLRAMEDAGELSRGMFVEGMGPAQFAPRDVVEALRAAAADGAAGSSRLGASGGVAACAVLPADDPACLFGAGIPWPEVAWEAAGAAPAIDAALVAAKPVRREGALVVVAAGRPVLWAAPRLKSVLAFTSDPDALAAAVASLVAFMRAALKREGSAASRRKIVVEHFNARDVLETPLADLLQAEGFARLPDGMRLYTTPF